MTNFEYERLHHNLKLLKLGTFESVLDNYLEIAAKEKKSTIEILDYLVDRELKSKEYRSLALRTRKAGFPMEKKLDDFDFGFQPSLDKGIINDIASLKFIHNAENVVLLGPPGVGKTHIAIASALIERLAKADREKRLEEMIRELSRFQLIIIDEMGYLPFDDFGAHCFFQLVSRRYERASIIFTSNKSYGEWGDIFKDHVIAAAILDRILHHCTTVNIKGDSYRLKDRKRQGIIPQSFSG
jgi:DNA replication protein DnaC